ncbi:GtrA family protein [Niveibacterium umoris]|uniref:Putative flippase GtrA n=1 Tax=Niveibacterium umoris TaxID=1193620 RepID=A0A840BL13_9RHOO|nr:GtrA family protein [Niveibacterium umoris]MBB4012258.1 putative flippase GtrA [Niveibacterium umoris]
MKLASLYAIFALIATAANICAQDLTVRIYEGPFSVTFSILVGTGVGLVMKYLLDKRYIFGFRARNAAHDAHTFLLYTLMGIVTTAIFWGFEFGFDLLFQSKGMRYLGGILGLAIGYLSKYQLDKRYVFRENAS